MARPGAAAAGGCFFIEFLHRMIRVAWQVAGQVAPYGSSYGASASYISEPAQLPGPWLAPKCAMKTVVSV